MKSLHFSMLLAMLLIAKAVQGQAFVYIDTYQSRPQGQGEAIQVVSDFLRTILEKDTVPPMVFLANGMEPIMSHTMERLEAITDSLELYHLSVSDPAENLNRTLDLFGAAGHPLSAYCNQTYFLMEPEYSLKDRMIRPLMVISDGMENPCDVLPSHSISYRTWNGTAFISTTLSSLCDEE